MTKRRTRVFRQPSRLALPVVAAALAMMAGAAKAEPNPYTFKISETLTYDDNIFRLPTNELRDGISSTALSFGLDQPIGRQHLYANATVRRDIYKNWDELDNTGYDIGAGLDWEAASRWAGDASFRFTRALAAFDNYGNLTGVDFDKNEEKVGYAAFRARYGLVSLWSIEGLYNHLDVTYSDADFADRERSSDTAGLGVLFRPSGLWTFGLAGRWTRGEYPHAVGGRDEFDRTDFDLTAKYVATGLSTLSARLSHTNENHDLATTRDFSGLTGQIDWFYQATGKLSFNTTLARETGSGASSSSLSSTGGSTSTPGYLNDSRLTSRLGVTANWAATAKIKVKGSLEYWHDKYDGEFTNVGGATGSADDSATSRALSLSAFYEATRAVSFECGARYEKRDELRTATDVFPGYTATTAFCTGNLALN